MRIGIDGHVLGKNIGGVERFVRELVDKLPSEAPLNQYIVFVTKKEFARLSTIEKSQQVEYVELASGNTIIERLFLLPWLSRKYQLDALLIQRLAPWFCGKTKLISTIHDLTPIKFPDRYRGLSNVLVRLLTKNTIKRSSLILTPTKTIKAEIKAYCSESQVPIVAYYNGVDTGAFKRPITEDAQSRKQPYLLTVGAIESRKNLETILRALPLVKEHPDLQLRIVGSVRDQVYYQGIQAEIVALGLADRVEHMGFLSEEALILLYQEATLFITASRDEGFNIPPLEAMACGVPVACSDILVHQELFTEAALFFNIDDPSDLAAQIALSFKNKQNTVALIEKGYARVATFTWENAAKHVAASLKHLEP